PIRFPSQCSRLPYTTLFRSGAVRQTRVGPPIVGVEPAYDGFGLVALRAPGPREVGFRRRENRAEDPDDATDLARLTTVVDQDEADHRGHDGAVHQVLPRNRRGSPESPTEDDVDDQRGRHGGILA